MHQGEQSLILHPLQGIGTPDICFLILSVAKTQHKGFLFYISSCLCYLVAPTATTAKDFTLIAFFTPSHLFCRWKCPALLPHRAAGCLNTAWGLQSETLLFCKVQGASDVQSWKCLFKLMFPGTSRSADSTPQPLEGQISQCPSGSSGSSWCTKQELPGEAWAASMLRAHLKRT